MRWKENKTKRVNDIARKNRNGTKNYIKRNWKQLGARIAVKDTMFDVASLLFMF